MSDDKEKFCRVKLVFRKDTKHYYADIDATDGRFLLDLGTEEENVDKVIKILEEEFGGIYISPGGLN